MSAPGGRDASLVGNIANGRPAEGPSPNVSLTRTHVHHATVRSDASGHRWLIVGTDSGFEATTALFYQSIDVTLTPVV